MLIIDLISGLCRYFLWDTIDAIVNFVDLGFVLHGTLCHSLAPIKPASSAYAMLPRRGMHNHLQPHIRTSPLFHHRTNQYSRLRTQRPFLQYFSPRFLLWELSTPFLNIHWFLDKTGRTGSTFQLVNGILLLCTFFGVRIVYGWYTVRLRPFSAGLFLNNIFSVNLLLACHVHEYP